MQHSGYIKVSWPYDDTFDFSTRFPKIRPLLFAHGMTYRVATSSSFLLFAGTQDSAAALAEKVTAIDSGFIVEWEPENDHT